ncbi:Membrane-associated lipoprotein [Mesomycoplasma hyopneumoniae]|uniref:Membrane-associated lipoprotein n=1 Tax=Mesomycoplasma hyopneumoniae TaxID=2099 RepID=A0A223M988_MESHO|nr:Membrane-associated lipoprotein [Mesomycoplasma hyopneumoniae]
MQQTSRGTMWILDFAPPTDSSQQPTKWYFGTNNHVVESYKKNASHFSMTILKPEVGIRTKLKTAKGASDESYLTASFSRENLEQNAKTDNPQNKTAEYISPDGYGIPGIRIIYRATDFMTTSPKDFLSEADKKNEKYKDIEEFADFAVLEVDFSKFKVPDQYSSRNDFIKAITNDYYNKKEDHIKFLKTSYLKNYEKADTKLATTDNSKKKILTNFLLSDTRRQLVIFSLINIRIPMIIITQKSDILSEWILSLLFIII